MKIAALALALSLTGCAVQPDVKTLDNAKLCNTKGQALGFGNEPLLNEAKAEIARRSIPAAECEKEAAEGLEFAKNYQLQQQTVNGINQNTQLMQLNNSLIR